MSWLNYIVLTLNILKNLSNSVNYEQTALGAVWDQTALGAVWSEFILFAIQYYHLVAKSTIYT